MHLSTLTRDVDVDKHRDPQLAKKRRIKKKLKNHNPKWNVYMCVYIHAYMCFYPHLLSKLTLFSLF